MSTKMSDDERERLRLATASIEKLDAAAAKEESLLRKLVTLLDKEGIVKFKKIQIIACNTFTFTFSLLPYREPHSYSTEYTTFPITYLLPLRNYTYSNSTRQRNDTIN